MCCQLISRARRLSRAKIFLPLVNFTRQLQFCLRCTALLIRVLIHIPIHLPVLEWILYSYFDANHSRHVQLIELKSRRAVLPGIASMLLLLLPRLVSNFPVVQQMSSCPPFPSLCYLSVQSLHSIYVHATIIQFDLPLPACLCFGNALPPQSPSRYT